MPNRIGRLEFLFWSCAPLLLSALVLAISAIAMGYDEPQDIAQNFRGSMGIVVVVVTLIILRAQVARLHDLGQPGWLILLFFLPVIGAIVFLLLIVLPGAKSANKYGDPTKFFQWVRKKKQFPIDPGPFS